jgi:outer membrane cobalamin receptor
MEKISSGDIHLLPSIGGQADLAQYLQVLPGIIFSGDQGGQLYIRGGSAIQNKVLLDGMVIYNPFHSIGLFSVFETDIIRNVDVYTGGFNAQYGGRISSIMDITTKDGNKKFTSAKVSLSTFGANLLLEGPLLKDNEKRGYSVSYILSAKNSYLSKTSKNIYSYIDGSLPYDFFDLYGKATLAATNGSKLNIFGFNFSDDVTQYKSIADFNWTNRGIGGNFVLLPGGTSAIIEGVFAYSDYTMKMSDNGGDKMSDINSFNVGLN